MHVVDFESYFEHDDQGHATKCFPCVCDSIHTEIHNQEHPHRMTIRAKLYDDNKHISAAEQEEKRKHKKQCEDPEDDIHECFGELLVCKL